MTVSESSRRGVEQTCDDDESSYSRQKLLMPSRLLVQRESSEDDAGDDEMFDSDDIVACVCTTIEFNNKLVYVQLLGSITQSNITCSVRVTVLIKVIYYISIMSIT